nr:MAG TPA: hypothetical protein [Caudoviricetes sp.]
MESPEKKSRKKSKKILKNPLTYLPLSGII